VTATEADNILKIEASIQSFSPKLQILVDSPSDKVACPVMAHCQLCDNQEDCSPDFDIFANFNATAYDSNLIYTCPLGSKFEGGNEKHEIFCGWDEEWIGNGTQLAECEGK